MMGTYNWRTTSIKQELMSLQGLVQADKAAQAVAQWSALRSSTALPSQQLREHYSQQAQQQLQQQLQLQRSRLHEPSLNVNDASAMDFGAQYGAELAAQQWRQQQQQQQQQAQQQQWQQRQRAQVRVDVLTFAGTYDADGDGCMSDITLAAYQVADARAPLSDGIVVPYDMCASHGAVVGGA